VRADLDPWAERWPDGTAASQADQFFDDLRTLAGGASEVLDLRSVTSGPGGSGVPVAFVEVRAICIEVASSSAAGVSMAPAAADGWTALLAAAGDALQVQPGARVVFGCPADGSYPTSPTSKDLQFSSLSLTLSATYRVTIVGTSA